MAVRPRSTTLAPLPRIATTGPWLIVFVAVRYALAYPWDAAAWAEVRRHIPWLLAEQDQIRKAGWIN